MSTAPEHALLSFMVGSPQAFIAAARTLRDLWAGSYIVSWLTAKAMQPIIRMGDNVEFVTPHVDRKHNDLLKAAGGQPTGDDLATLPSVPNKFCAIVPSDRAEELRSACIHAAEQAWMEIGDEVRDRLHHKIFANYPGWDKDWSAQVNSFFEFFAVTKPLRSRDRDWDKQWNELGQLTEMMRSVSHVPAYRASSDLVPAKCSLLGSYEQMGPADLAESRRFWQAACKFSIEGTRLQSVDRLCAISLVKRFAWPVYFAPKLNLDPRVLRFSDTATIAARRWLKSADIDPNDIRRQHKDWNGQWLHWDKPEQEPDEKCPSDLFSRIKELRQPTRFGSPPIYYALLHLDGDNMGRFFRGDVAQFQKTTLHLTKFGEDVRKIVDACHGELIYCGGDDILAALPTSTAMQCAQLLNSAFQKAVSVGENIASISGGIAVMHYKEDLRYALQVVRDAERLAKNIDQGPRHGGDRQKSAVSITVCRHSGEHTSFVIGWQQADRFQELIRLFQEENVSDRWAYKLMETSPILGSLSEEAIASELDRTVARTEGSNPLQLSTLKSHLSAFWNEYYQEMTGHGRNWHASNNGSSVNNVAILNNFVTLCRSASFMARGRN